MNMIINQDKVDVNSHIPHGELFYRSLENVKQTSEYRSFVIF